MGSALVNPLICLRGQGPEVLIVPRKVNLAVVKSATQMSGTVRGGVEHKMRNLNELYKSESAESDTLSAVSFLLPQSR